LRAIHVARAFALVPLLAGAAVAGDVSTETASITNRTDKVQTLEVTRGGETTSVTLEPGKALVDLCSESCTVKLVGADDGTFVLEGNERVSIENGAIYYDDQPGSARR